MFKDFFGGGENEQQQETGVDATTLLKKDHEEVKQMMSQWKNAEEQEKKQLTKQILKEIKVHAQLEELLFYPKMREVQDLKEVVARSLVEHRGVELLIADMEQMGENDEMYDATFQVITEMVKHHIQEEEKDLLPKAGEAGVDLTELGEEMETKKMQLMKEADKPVKIVRTTRGGAHRKAASTRGRKAASSRGGRKIAAKSSTTRSKAASKAGKPSGKARSTKSTSKSNTATKSKIATKSRTTTRKTATKARTPQRTAATKRTAAKKTTSSRKGTTGTKSRGKSSKSRSK
jgi:hemerythrin superfamily protein